MDLFSNDFDIFESFKLENDTLFDGHRTYDINKEGVYTVYIAFCSADSHTPLASVDDNISIRIIESHLEFKNNNIGFLSADNYMKYKVRHLY